MEKMLGVIFFVGIMIMSTNSIAPEDICKAEGETVCANCQMVGICNLNPSSGEYEIENRTACDFTMDEYCDNSILVGSCLRYAPNSTMCACHGDTNCFKDPNTENVYISCSGDNNMDTGRPFYCDPENIITSECVCSVDITTTTTETTTAARTTTEEATASTSLSCSEDCPYIDDINDPCAKYFICGNGELISNSCPGTLCFNQETCYCE
ncbi:UNVERIFIED_CONTAM: hypothetical protein RMT77_010623 [Armadillidium vulgare]